jgi:hypothetical protein
MKWADSAGQKQPEHRGQALYSLCDPENTLVQSRVIVNGFLVGTPLAWLLMLRRWESLLERFNLTEQAVALRNFSAALCKV